MRFLIGLIFGAGLIFAVAGALGSGSGGLAARLPAWLDGVALQVGDWLSLPPRPGGGAGESVERVPAGDLAGPPADAATDPASLPAASEPIPRPPEPRPVDAVADDDSAAQPADDPRGGPSPVASAGTRAEDVQALVAEIFGPRGASEDRTPDSPPATAAQLPEPVAARPPAPTAADGPSDAGGFGAGLEGAGVADGRAAGRAAGSQTVWVPFHSQMSAAGFAARLSESLGHPFDVERRGPGRYQVVFAYGDETERSALLEEAAAVTGLPL